MSAHTLTHKHAPKTKTLSLTQTHPNTHRPPVHGAVEPAGHPHADARAGAAFIHIHTIRMYVCM